MIYLQLVITALNKPILKLNNQFQALRLFYENVVLEPLILDEMFTYLPFCLFAFQQVRSKTGAIR